MHIYVRNATVVNLVPIMNTEIMKATPSPVEMITVTIMRVYISLGNSS